MQPIARYKRRCLTRPKCVRPLNCFVIMVICLMDEGCFLVQGFFEQKSTNSSYFPLKQKHLEIKIKFVRCVVWNLGGCSIEVTCVPAVKQRSATNVAKQGHQNTSGCVHSAPNRCGYQYSVSWSVDLVFRCSGYCEIVWLLILTTLCQSLQLLYLKICIKQECMCLWCL